MLNWFMREREVYADEKDVITILNVINKHLGWFSGEIGNCGWKNNPERWFISFRVSNRQFGKIIIDLKKLGKFDLDVRPGGQIDLCYKIEEES